MLRGTLLLFKNLYLQYLADQVGKKINQQALTNMRRYEK